MCVTEIELLPVEAEGTEITIVSYMYVIGCQPDTIIFEILTFNEANKESYKVEILQSYVSTESRHFYMVILQRHQKSFVTSS